MKKRKGGDADEDGISERKRKVSSLVDEKQRNKPSEFVRTVKGLLQKEQTRLAGLKKLLNALNGSQNKESVESIVKEGGEFQEVFKILEGGRHNLSQLEIQTCLEILESILLSTAEESHLSSRTGMAIVQRVLLSHLSLLYSCLNPVNPPEVIKSALKLLTAMVTQGASAAREVQRTFDFTLKSLSSLPNKRDSKSVQDVRTCFIYFCLSFLMFGDLAVMKQILELKGFLQSIMKGLQFDAPDVVHTVLSTLQGQVVHNSGITKKTKVQFFNSFVLSQLANLYQYAKDTEEESNDEEHKPDKTVRHKVHDLLLKICGSLKLGICFSNTAGAFTSRSNNPVLLKFLQSLTSVTTDVLIQELVITVLSCCHDLLKPFLSSLSATYEPRLSMPWIANMNLVTKIYMALPQPSQMLEKSGLKMSAEMLPSLINVIVPLGVSRTGLSRGVQHACSLVKHTTLSLLVVILKRAQNTAGYLTSSTSSHHINAASDSPEAPLLQQFREEVIKALPDVTTIISLRQNLASGKAKTEPQEEETACPTVLLAQSLKVIHGFLILWPSVLSHVNFDLRKLLPGQEEMALPPIVQQLTLQILLQAPPGSLKWYQQKGKSSTFFVYSVLNLYTSAKSEDIKNDAKQLLWKLLSEMGLVSSYPHRNEVETWLSHLCHNQLYEGHKEALLRFLDEVFSAVTAEPYIYTDIVIDMQTEVVAQDASEEKIGVDSTDSNWSRDASLPVSLLLVGALKQYSQLLYKINESDKEAAEGSLGCIARYMNCVIFDMIHSTLNPAILCFTVLHYYDGIELPDHLIVIRSLHKALVQHVNCWFPAPMQGQGVTRVLKESPMSNDKGLKELHSFLAKTTVNCEQEKVAALTDLYHHLESLSDLQLRTVIVDCVDFCKHRLSEDFSPLVQVLQVKNCNITGSTVPETIASLLQALPFSNLLWQVLREVIQDATRTPNEIQLAPRPEIPSMEDSTPSPLHSSWMQNLLMTALEKEPLLKTVPLCCHLLLCLGSLKTKLVIANRAEQGRLQSAIELCFQLLQYLLQRLLVLQQNTIKNKTNSDEQVMNAGRPISVMDSYKPDKQDFNLVEDTCCTVLHHPVVLNSFLWKPQHLPDSCRVSQDVSTELTYNVVNLLLAVLPSLTLPQKKSVMAPFVSKLCNDGMMEIQSAQNGTVVPSSQALYLLGIFHDYCDKERQAKFISELVQLPSNMLITTDPVSKETAPSALLMTLLMLLEGESLGEEKLPYSSSFQFKDIPLKMEEPLSVFHFKLLIKISEDVNCAQLDSAILKLLQKSLLYVLASTTTLLDACLNKPTGIKVSIAVHLVTHSPALRSHFELCCLRTPNTKKKKKLKTPGKPFSFEDHLVEYLPLASSYLLCIQGMRKETSDRTRTQAVVSQLVQAYWAPLWEWLVRDREGIFIHNEELCMELLTSLIHTMQRDGSLNEKLNELFTKASVWDSYQLRICHALVTSVCRDGSTSDLRADAMSNFCFACMEFLSSVLRGSKDGDESVIEDTLSHLESICKNAISVSVVEKDCTSKWNDFMTNCLRYKFESANVLRTLRSVIKSLYKEQDSNKSLFGELLSLETLYEMVLSHSQFLDVIFSSDGRSCNTKEALAELMVTVVELNPNCCKSSHLPVLFAAYSASLSITDQSILYLLSLYEKNHTSFKNYRPFLWGAAAAHHHQTTKSLGPSLWQQPSVTEVLEQIDANKMYQSAVSFPQSRLLQPQVQNELSRQSVQDVYDPCFLLPLFSCLLAPNFQVDCRKFVERGCLGFAIASLSSRDAQVRQAGYHVLSRYMVHLEGTRFKERKQIFHLLTCLKNSITEANCRISSLMVCFVARVAHILLKPEHSFYIMMNSFLLQRPALNLRDLPLFLTMFNSSSMQHITERSWMLQLLVDGMKDSPDYYLYKRRHVIELALSYHDSPVSDHHSRKLVSQLLLSALKIHPAAYDLTKNYGIVAWIHSLCYNSPGRLSASLELLHTLWFTLHAVDKINEDFNGEEKHVRLPPNLAQECALVCWTLLEQLRSCPVVADTFSYLQMLASIITYLAANEQPSGLSCDRILSLLGLWCAAFDETLMLNQLLSSLKLNEVLSSDVQTGATCECDYNKLKTQSLSSLLAILTSWQPSGAGTNQVSLQQTELLVWHFGLMCCRELSQVNKVEIACPSSSRNQTPVCLLTLLSWFRKCIVQDRELQDRLVTENPTSEIKLLVQLYQTVPSNNATAVLHVEHFKRAENSESRLAVARELNVICLVLLAAVQRNKRKGIKKGLLQPKVCYLISQEPYGDIITKGLETVILPVLPDPCKDLEEESYHQDEDVVLQDLLSLLMQELWSEIPIPFQFLSYLLSQGDSGNPVVDSIIEALGGSKTVTKWIQKDV